MLLRVSWLVISGDRAECVSREWVGREGKSRCLRSATERWSKRSELNVWRSVGPLSNGRTVCQMSNAFFVIIIATNPKAIWEKAAALSLDPVDLLSQTPFISDQPFCHNALDRHTLTKISLEGMFSDYRPLSLYKEWRHGLIIIVLWCCWLGITKSIWSVKNWVISC